jgi:hypothetical protein
MRGMSGYGSLRRQRELQKGLGLFGLLVFGGLLVLAAVMALKVVPTVLEYRVIKRVIDAVRHEPNPPAIRAAFDRAAAIEHISAITGRDLDIHPAPGGGYHIAFSYEKKVPLIGPVSLALDYRGDTR